MANAEYIFNKYLSSASDDEVDADPKIKKLVRTHMPRFFYFFPSIRKVRMLPRNTIHSTLELRTHADFTNAGDGASN